MTEFEVQTTIRPRKSEIRSRKRLHVEALESRHLLAAQPIINEFVAANDGSLVDGDGNESDWIELFNAGDEVADLDGWYLTDNAADLQKWQFPDGVHLAPGEFLVLFASSPTDSAGNRLDDYVDAAGHLHTSFSLDADGEYLALVKPDGQSIASEFAPKYPEQKDDIAYGVGQQANEVILLSDAAPGNYWVPESSAALPSDWNEPSFDADVWKPFAGSLGYDTSLSGGTPTELTGYWKLNEGSGVTIDDFGGDADGTTNTIAGDSSWSADAAPTTFPNPYSLEMDGTDDIISTNFAGIAGANDRTVSAWIKTDNPSRLMTIVHWGTNATGQRFTFRTNSGAANGTVGALRLEIQGSYVTANTNVADGQWHHVAVTFSGTNIYDAQLFVDGELDGANGSFSGQGSNGVVNTNIAGENVTIGNGFGTARTWDGWIDDVRIYDVALDAEEISLLATDPTTEGLVAHWPLDEGTGAISADVVGDHTAKLGNMTVTSGATWLGDVPEALAGESASLGFNGNDAHVLVASQGVSESQDRSVAFWVKTTASTAGGLVAWGDQDVPGGKWHVTLNASASNGPLGTARVEVNGGYAIGSTLINDGRWHHVAVTFADDGTPDIAEARIYVDGQLDIIGGSSSAPVNTITAIGAGDPINIGRRRTSATAFQYFQGQMSDVAVFASALTAEQVAWLAAGTVRPDELVTFLPAIDTDILADTRSRNASVFLQKPFGAPLPIALSVLTMDVRYDDGFVAFLNGTEVVRRLATDALVWNSSASGTRSDREALVGESIDLSPYIGLLTGSDVLAVQLLNASANDDDLLLAVELRGLAINQSDVGYLDPPTPGQPNGPISSGFVADTTFSVDRGFFENAFDVVIATDTLDAQIYYTLDGSVPSAENPSATLYKDPIPVATTKTLRAVAVKEGLVSSNVDTQTYIFLDDVLRQPAAPEGYPTQWIGRETIAGDYEMDPEIVDDLEYGPQLADALRALPTVSLVMPADDWFDAETGIYSNSEERGDFWERAVSVEFFDFADGREFQVEAGIQMQGNASRWPSRPKHNMRLVFADRFGPGRLNFSLFDNTGIDRFNSIVLRGGNGDSWINPTVFGKAQYIRDQWHRDIQNLMGHDNSLQRYMHLYINGMYWGLFHVFERVEAQFLSEHFGGRPEDYEVVKDIRNSGGQVEALDGTTDAWLDMIDRAKGDMTNPDAYASVLEYLDLDNFIDYVMVNFYSANNDWDQSNWRAGRLKEGGKFQFFFWDAERSDLNAGGNGGANTPVGRDITGKNNVNYPTWLHQRLSVNPDYQIAWADRIQKHLFRGGALTPESTAAAWNARADEIRLPIIAESARWGDAHVANPRTQATWEDQLRDVTTLFLPVRTGILLEQLKNRDLFPNISAPEFSDRGGTVAAGFNLELSTDEVTTSVGTILLPEGHDVQALVPTDNSLDSVWYSPDFTPDAAWANGRAGVGFDRSTTGLHEAIQLNVEDDWSANQTSIYSRSQFSIDLDSISGGAFDQLTLRMKYDDGFIAYLNGVEVARSSNAPDDQPTFDTLVLGGRPDDEVLAFLDFEITAFQDLIVDDEDGVNLLALHGFNATRFSNDMLVSAELVGRHLTDISTAPIYYTLDGSDPRLPGGGINDLGSTTLFYEGPISLNATSTVRARVLLDGQWSALDEATFVVNPAPASSLTVSEIHYNPADATPAELAIIPGADNDDFEFIEVMNVGTESVNLLGVRFDDGIDFTFGNVELAASQRVVVVRDQAAFGGRYGDTIRVAGEYGGALNNGGERVRLVVANGDVAVDFAYSDNNLWPRAADGVGGSLELIHPADSLLPLDKYYRWRSSGAVGGSPGKAAADHLGVVVSEVLANTDEVPNRTDSIELHNTTDAAVDIGGWYLSDSANDMLKFRIPTGTVLAADAYIVFDENDFNPTPSAPAPHHFALSGSQGDDVWLVIPDGDRVATIVDDVHFGPTFSGQSLGLTAQSQGRLAPLSRIGLGCGGNQVFVPGTVIEVINYLPGEASAAALAIEPNLDNNDLEYVIVGSQPATSLAGWRIRGGIDFEFPAFAQTGDWIVSFDPDAPENANKVAAFRAQYGLSDTFPKLLGGYAGSLNDTGEQLRLKAPVSSQPGDPTITAYVTVDEVIYDDRGDWPAAMPGEAISRRRTTYFGNDGSLWEYRSQATPTPLHEKGDLNGDGTINLADLEQLIDAVKFEIQNTEYVFDTTLLTPTENDIDAFVRNILKIAWGDATSDGNVDATDLNQVGLRWQQTVCGGWSHGDFDGDNFIDATDLNVIGLNWLAAAALRNAQARVLRTPRAALHHPGVITVADLDASHVVDQTVHVNARLADTNFTFSGASNRRGRQWLSASYRRNVTRPAEVCMAPTAANVVDELFARLG